MHGTCPTPLVYTENPTITAKAKREGECSADMAGSVPSPAASKPAARVASLPPASRPPSPPRSFVVEVFSERHLPLVRSKALDFEAEAVFREEFIKNLMLQNA
ncbi:hypothetical protein OPV22_015470 [Ensete ventricosum]|uniref:Uncharacterized protein n=1 Tax=Ensete ventricosum TaxID=4639 RepID=A0AAV8PLR2_ENSVE|nr:hypothetical protein OPV22_015470 [Ensete ventricosum]